MEADEMRAFVGFEVARDRIGNHGMKFCQGITLGGDSSAASRIPPCHETTGLPARFNLECDFIHASKLTYPLKKHNPSKDSGPSGRVRLG